MVIIRPIDPIITEAIRQMGRLPIELSGANASNIHKKIHFSLQRVDGALSLLTMTEGRQQGREALAAALNAFADQLSTGRGAEEERKQVFLAAAELAFQISAYRRIPRPSLMHAACRLVSGRQSDELEFFEGC